MEGIGKVHVTQAPAFSLPDEEGNPVSLADILRAGPAVLVFYPKDFFPVCTSQLCNYRDNIEEFRKIPAEIYAISCDTPDSHRKFKTRYGFPFRLLSDPEKKVAQAYGCSSLLMFGGISRAVVIVNRQGKTLYQYIEPTILTRRKSDEVISILADLKANGLL